MEEEVKLFACEPLTGDLIDLDTARAMRLPISYGWDHWVVFKGKKPLRRFHNFRAAIKFATNNGLKLIA